MRDSFTLGERESEAGHVNQSHYQRSPPLHCESLKIPAIAPSRKSMEGYLVAFSQMIPVLELLLLWIELQGL